MVVIRPVELDDLDDLVELAKGTGFGLTTLPQDRYVLRRRIATSQEGFASEAIGPAGETCLFVLEDLDAKKVVGTAGVVSAVGLTEPFYTYNLETTVIQSKMLKLRKEIQILHMMAERNGPAEIGSLFLHPAYRRDRNGRLLSLSRFLFVAEQPQRFEGTLIAEMRGVIDDKGNSPFWDALGRHFFNMDFPEADKLILVDKQFIADLMPPWPIYVCLLPPEAREVIGKVHMETKPAIRLLEEEGFAFNGRIDIFEGGPVVGCRRDDIRTIRDSIRATVTAVVDDPFDGEMMLISNARHEFRACKATIQALDDPAQVRLAAPVAKALQVEPGQAIRYAPLHPKANGR
jgi:arginine N-succinyltransferase